MAALQDYTRLKRTAPDPAGRREDLAWSLVLESLVFAAEAEVRWLDHCEARLRRAASERSGPAAAPGPTTGPTAGSAPMTHDEGARR